MLKMQKFNKQNDVDSIVSFCPYGYGASLNYNPTSSSKSKPTRKPMNFSGVTTSGTTTICDLADNKIVGGAVGVGVAVAITTAAGPECLGW